jgi:hypothetical protein
MRLLKDILGKRQSQVGVVPHPMRNGSSLSEGLEIEDEISASSSQSRMNGQRSHAGNSTKSATTAMQMQIMMRTAGVGGVENSSNNKKVRSNKNRTRRLISTTNCSDETDLSSGGGPDSRMRNPSSTLYPHLALAAFTKIKDFTEAEEETEEEENFYYQVGFVRDLRSL